MVSYMALCGALDRAQARGQFPRYYVKGGVALELRLAGKARTSQDLDLSIEAERHRIVRVLDEALAGGYDDFSFERKTAVGTREFVDRIEMAVRYNSRDWNTIKIDLSSDTDAQAIEEVSAFEISVFGVNGPNKIPCLSIVEQMAQKIHASTEPSTDLYRNDRYRDVLDVYLLDTFIVDDDPALRLACERIFAERRTHGWPPSIEFPERWMVPIGSMAEELNLAVSSARVVRTFSAIIARLFGLEVSLNYQYRFVVLAAQQQVPNVLQNAIDFTDEGYTVFKRWTEEEGWRLAQLMQYPSRDGTRAMLAILEKTLDEPGGR